MSSWEKSHTHKKICWILSQVTQLDSIWQGRLQNSQQLRAGSRWGQSSKWLNFEWSIWFTSVSRERKWKEILWWAVECQNDSSSHGWFTYVSQKTCFFTWPFITVFLTTTHTEPLGGTDELQCYDLQQYSSEKLLNSHISFSWIDFLREQL